MSARHNQAAAIGGTCLLIAFGVILPLAYAMQAIRVYGPALRELILATVTPQFAAGMFFMAFVACLAAFCIGMGARR